MTKGPTSSRGVLGALADVLAAPYAGAVRLQRWAYRRGVLPSHAAGVPVVCVGNLTTGGTGKTPMVAWVVRHLQQRGRKPAILTRGYKARRGVSDEAELLKALTGADVVVQADRVAGAAGAVAAGADVCVMDDGFQHLRLRRDFNILLLDATRPVETLHCPPCGLMREGLWAVRDAQAVVLTRCDLASEADLAALERRVRAAAPRAVVARAVHQAAAVIDEAGTRAGTDSLAGRKVLAFCGLGNPRAFFQTLERLGATLAGAQSLGDHAAYSQGDLARLEADARAAGADALVTTEKDYVKLARLARPGNLWRLAVEIRFVAGEAELTPKLDAAVSR
ncbi:MAG: tetraacyldisaccharide 4'-kinase [Planctomycetota bacterium]|nr:tetraacyldisaccharide 4'-kinase [Planctomycetota bacterium]